MRLAAAKKLNIGDRIEWGNHVLTARTTERHTGVIDSILDGDFVWVENIRLQRREHAELPIAGRRRVSYPLIIGRRQG